MKEKRENRVTIRLTNRELALLKANNSNMSVFIRDAALEKADKYKIIEDEEIIELENEEKLLKGKLDFLESKYKETHKVKEYNFEKFTNGISDLEKVKEASKLNRGNFVAAAQSNDPQGIDFETDPIRIDNSDSKFEINNEDAIIFDLKRDKKN